MTPIDIAQFVLNILLAIFTVTLFRQGQKDRRRVTEDREREQASKVTLLRQWTTSPTKGGGWNIEGVRLEVRNDSSLPITHVQIHQDLTPPGQSQPAWGAVMLTDDMQSVHIPGGAARVFEDSSDLSTSSLELHFTDGSGQSWVRRESDGTLWRTGYQPGRWWQRWYQRRALGKLGKLFNWPMRYALDRARKTAPRVPFAARISRFLWGTSTPVMPDPEPWRRPWNVREKDWPYQSLFWTAEFMQKYPPQESKNLDAG